MIVQSSRDIALAIEKQLQGRFLVSICCTGEAVIEEICRFSPDILVFDMLLPGVDGITVLRAVNSLGIRPVVICIASVFTYYMDLVARELGVAYMISKPCDPCIVAAHIAKLSGYSRELLLPYPDEKTIVANMLLSLGFSEKHMGFGCLQELILQVKNQPELSYTKELYPAVGKLRNCSGAQVERGIRTALDAAWRNGDEAVWRLYFLKNPNDRRMQPTNGEFIQCLAHLLANHKEVAPGDTIRL
jgi:two-component system response regulator (stage 0 sporulation protein A)